MIIFTNEYIKWRVSKILVKKITIREKWIRIREKYTENGI
jgi:hypothetical protein